MKKSIRKFLAAVLVVSTMLILAPTVSMAETAVEPITSQQENEIMPRFTYIADALCDLEINGTTATVDCWVAGQYGEATKAKVIAELQVKNGSSWLPVAIWTDTQDNYKASVKEDKSVVTGHTYRVKATFTVWEGSQSEERIFFTNEVTA